MCTYEMHFPFDDYRLTFFINRLGSQVEALPVLRVHSMARWSVRFAEHSWVAARCSAGWSMGSDALYGKARLSGILQADRRGSETDRSWY